MVRHLTRGWAVRRFTFHTDEVFGKYLQCGDPHFGFVRIRCRECGAEYLRDFSCKCRGFCPSCSKRKSLDLAIFLEEELFRSVNHRHWVWSVPKMLMLHFLHHRKLLPKLCRCAWDSITMFRTHDLWEFELGQIQIFCYSNGAIIS